MLTRPSVHSPGSGAGAAWQRRHLAPPALAGQWRGRRLGVGSPALSHYPRRRHNLRRGLGAADLAGASRRPEILDQVLAWYDDQAPDAEHLIIIQAADTDALARLAAHGYRLDEKAGPPTTARGTSSTPGA